MSDILQQAQKKQTDLNNQITESKIIQKQRPLFHFATPGGWCNDPNGFSQFDNKIHMFFSIIHIPHNGGQCTGDT